MEPFPRISLPPMQDMQNSQPPQMNRRIVRMSPIENRSLRSRSGPFAAKGSLIVLFFLSFVLPLYFGLRVTGILTPDAPTVTADSDATFPSSVLVKDDASF